MSSKAPLFFSIIRSNQSDLDVFGVLVASWTGIEVYWGVNISRENTASIVLLRVVWVLGVYTAVGNKRPQYKKRDNRVYLARLEENACPQVRNYLQRTDTYTALTLLLHRLANLDFTFVLKLFVVRLLL